MLNHFASEPDNWFAQFCFVQLLSWMRRAPSPVVFRADTGARDVKGSCFFFLFRKRELLNGSVFGPWAVAFLSLRPSCKRANIYTNASSHWQANSKIVRF
jgi:hypothetical protein